MTEREEIRKNLIDAIKECGFPTEFGIMIADSLGTEKTMARMYSWVKSFQPDRAEDVADEMLAIKSDFERYQAKIINEKINEKYINMRWNGDFGLPDE